MRRIVLIALTLPALAFGASFDCKLSTNRVERLICTNVQLSSLDEALSEMFLAVVEKTEFPARLRSEQKNWLSRRNSCADVSCVRQEYEDRIAQLSCDRASPTAGSAIWASQCASLSLDALSQELSLVEASYIRQASVGNNNPDYFTRTFKDEQSAWVSYRSAYCAHYGAAEGGSDGWKNAFSAICAVDETKKRIARLKGEISAK